METHINNIDSTIIFLIEYKKILEDNDIQSSNNLDILFHNSENIMNNYIETLYDILNYNNNINMDSKIKSVIKDSKEINNNINEVIPIILYYFANKLSIRENRVAHALL